MYEKENSELKKCLNIIARGNNSKFKYINEIYDFVQSKIFFVANNILRDREAAEDLTVDFWSKIVHIAQRSANVDNPMGYFVTVIKHMAYSYLEKREKLAAREVLAANDFFEEYIAISFDGRADEDRRMTTMVIDQALVQLDKAHRDIIIYIYFECKTLMECAQAFNISISDAGYRKKVALNILKEKLAEIGIDRYDP